jgi:hypothetical protein
MERWFWFADAPVRMAFADEALYRFAAPVLEELRQDAAQSAAFSLEFQTSCDLHRPPQEHLIYEGVLGAGISVDGRIFAGRDKEWLVVDGVGSAEIDLAERKAIIRIVPEANGQAASTIALFTFDVILSSLDQELLHGAALVLPQRAQSILLFAPSGAGKTTTSLALAMSGFGIITDDALVLNRRRSRWSAWGFPRPMKVHWRTADLLPALKGLLTSDWNRDGEQVLSRLQFATIGNVVIQGNAAVRAVFVLGERTSGSHVIERMSKADVALALATDNIGISRTGVPARHIRKLQAVTSLLTSPDVLSARLRVGPALQTLGSDISSYCGVSAIEAA